MEPREWQQAALMKWLELFRGVASVVTGGGKTVFAFMCMLEFLKRYEKGRFIIVVPTTALLDQWYVALCESLSVQEDEIACYSGEEKPDKPRQVNILVINTARTWAVQLASGVDSFLIVDECHRAGSPCNAQSLLGCHQATLGLSATPSREYDEGFEAYVAPVLGKIIYEYDYKQAFNEKVICPFRLINVEVDLLPDEAEKYRKLTRRCALELKRMGNNDKPSEMLTMLLRKRASVASTATLRIPVAAALAEKGRGRRTLIFHERVEDAEKIANILRVRNHNVTTYHTKIGPAMRRHNLLLFRRGIFDILVCCRALDEGMNVPETTIAIIASATSSSRQRIQRLGRVLRPSKGKDAATVYTIYATDVEKERLKKEERGLKGVIRTSWMQGKVLYEADSN